MPCVMSHAFTPNSTKKVAVTKAITHLLPSYMAYILLGVSVKLVSTDLNLLTEATS